MTFPSLSPAMLKPLATTPDAALKAITSLSALPYWMAGVLLGLSSGVWEAFCEPVLGPFILPFLGRFFGKSKPDGKPTEDAVAVVHNADGKADKAADLPVTTQPVAVAPVAVTKAPAQTTPQDEVTTPGSSEGAVYADATDASPKAEETAAPTPATASAQATGLPVDLASIPIAKPVSLPADLDLGSSPAPVKASNTRHTSADIMSDVSANSTTSTSSNRSRTSHTAVGGNRYRTGAKKAALR